MSTQSIAFVAMVGIAIISTAIAADLTSAPVKRLEVEYNKARAQSIQQLNTRYIASLEAVKRELMAHNDLDGANAAKALIDHLKKESVALSSGAGQGGLAEAALAPAGSILPMTPEGKFMLDTAQMQNRTVSFNLYGKPTTKAMLTINFTDFNTGTTATDGDVFLISGTGRPKKIGSWTAKESGSGRATFDLIRYLDKPGAYTIRFFSRTPMGVNLTPELRID